MKKNLLLLLITVVCLSVKITYAAQEVGLGGATATSTGGSTVTVTKSPSPAQALQGTGVHVIPPAGSKAQGPAKTFAGTGQKLGKTPTENPWKPYVEKLETEGLPKDSGLNDLDDFKQTVNELIRINLATPKNENDYEDIHFLIEEILDLIGEKKNALKQLQSLKKVLEDSDQYLGFSEQDREDIFALAELITKTPRQTVRGYIREAGKSLRNLVSGTLSGMRTGVRNLPRFMIKQIGSLSAGERVVVLALVGLVGTQVVSTYILNGPFFPLVRFLVNPENWYQFINAYQMIKDSLPSIPYWAIGKFLGNVAALGATYLTSYELIIGMLAEKGEGSLTQQNSARVISILAMFATQAGYGRLIKTTGITPKILPVILAILPAAKIVSLAAKLKSIPQSKMKSGRRRRRRRGRGWFS